MDKKISKLYLDERSYKQRLVYAILVSFLSCFNLAIYIFTYQKVDAELHCQTDDCDPLAFQINEININKNLVRTSNYEIMEASKIKKGEFMDELDFEGIVQDVAKLPWIDSVQVMRLFPETVALRIVEKQPIAMIFDGVAYYPVDARGQIVRKSFSDAQGLFITMGNNANEHIVDLLKALNKYPELKDRVVSSMWMGNRRWDIFIDDEIDGILIKLPEGNIDYSLKKLAEKQKEEQILDREIKEID
jgi:cell division protein FtsQ